VDPGTNTFTFTKASYTSQYVDLSTTEWYDRNGNVLQSPAAQPQSLFQTYAVNPYQGGQGSGFPFLDIANRFTLYAVQYDPAVLQGLDWQQIASDLGSPQSPVAQAIIGSANYLTAAICVTTGDQPSGVCSDPAIQSLESALKSETTVSPPAS